MLTVCPGMDGIDHGHFCVPAYSDPESACRGQAQDAPGSQQLRSTYDEDVVFHSDWRDQALVRPSKRQKVPVALAPSDSKLSLNDIDKRSGVSCQDVSFEKG